MQTSKKEQPSNATSSADVDNPRETIARNKLAIDNMEPVDSCLLGSLAEAQGFGGMLVAEIEKLKVEDDVDVNALETLTECLGYHISEMDSMRRKCVEELSSKCRVVEDAELQLETARQQIDSEQDKIENQRQAALDGVELARTQLAAFREASLAEIKAERDRSADERESSLLTRVTDEL